MSGTRIATVGVLTGWGAGTAALPADARAAASGRAVIPMPRPALDGERFRRATRECLAGIAAVETMLRDGGIGRDALRGPVRRVPPRPVPSSGGRSVVRGRILRA